jgi:hypothetical protein
MGSNPNHGMGVCVSLFRVCAVLYVGDGLIPIQRSPNDCVYRVKELQKRSVPSEGL